MKRRLTCAILLVMGAVCTQAVAQEPPLTLSERVERLERQTGGGGGGGMLADLVVEMRRLQQEVRRLHGEVERLTHELEGMQARQRDQYLDLDRRLQALGNPGAPAYEPERGRGVPNPVRVENEPEPETETQPPPEPDARSTSPESAGVGPAGAPPMDTQAREAAYAAAKDLLLEERYVEAAEAFRGFLQAYPRGPLSDNAQYWLGESYYVTGNFDLALNAFQAVISQFPDSTKQPDALLKLGYAYYELEQWEQARASLNQVIQQYGGSSEARLAESRLRLMRIQTAEVP